MGKFLEGKIALVTGGSRGIGRAICEELAAHGAHVIVNFTSKPEAAEESVAACKRAGGSAEALCFNVGDSSSVESAFEQILAKHGRLDILVNNAGIARDGLVMRMKEEDWRATMDVNLSGAYFCIRAVAKSMMKARTGKIVNISSVVGEMGNAGQVPYAASKAGLIGLTKSLAREFAPRNITVNCITPGFIETDMTGTLTEEIKSEMLKGIPLERFGSAKEVASVVGFLVSDGASYITGQVIGVNGGMYM